MRADKVVHRARTRVVALPLLLLVGAFAALPVSAWQPPAAPDTWARRTITAPMPLAVKSAPTS